VLLAGNELASGESGRNREVGSSARTSEAMPKTIRQLRNQMALYLIGVLLRAKPEGTNWRGRYNCEL
jgi:hypothetical protein